MLEEKETKRRRCHLDGFSFGMRGIKSDSSILCAQNSHPGVGSYAIEDGYKQLLRNTPLPRFQAAKRFRVQPSFTPGPGAYDHIVENNTDNEKNKATKKKNNFHSFSESKKESVASEAASQRTFASKNQNLDYLNTSPGLTSSSSAAAVSPNTFLSSLRGMEFSKYSSRPNDPHSHHNSSPSVGSYSLDSSRSPQSFSFPKSTRKEIINPLSSVSPGPAKYGISQESFSKSPLLNPVTTMSTAKRFFEETIPQSKLTPGPGTYALSDAAKYKRELIYSFGKQQKTDPFKWSYTPSPLSYNPLPEEPRKQAKIGTSQRPPVGNGSPGVGTYTVGSELGKNSFQKQPNKEENNAVRTPSDDYKLRLEQKIKQLIETSPNLSKNAPNTIIDFSLTALKQLNTPSPQHYDKILTVQKKPKNQLLFGQSKRSEDYLDVFGASAFGNRSPGPAVYSAESSPITKGSTLSKTKKKVLFDIPNTPGVGKYDLDWSPFRLDANKKDKHNSNSMHNSNSEYTYLDQFPDENSQGNSSREIQTRLKQKPPKFKIQK